MSGITESRLALGAALEAAGLRVTFDPYTVAPPAVFVRGATPWISPSHLVTRSRAFRWEVFAVAGKADAKATLEDLEDLTAATLLALHTLVGWGTPTFDAPGTVDVGGAQYLASVGRIDHLSEV